MMTVKLFRIGLRQITKDGMMLVLLPAPFLTGLIFKFAVPLINSITAERLSFSLTPWYCLADGFLVCLTPLFTAMICAFLLLEERDEGIGSFYQITPAAGYPYLTARIGLPMIWAFVVDVTALLVFNISNLSFFAILSSSFLSVLAGLSMAMMVVSLAGNRVEGLALSKLMGISLLGLFAWFIPSPFHFFGAFLPSFWIGKILMDGTNPFTFFSGTLICFIWIAFFTKKFIGRTE